MNIIGVVSSKLRDFRHYAVKHWKRLSLFAVLLILVFFTYRKFTSEPEGITSSRVYRMTLVSDFSANGKIKAKKQVDLKFYSPGRVSWIGVKNGDSVFARQTIASLDAVALNAAYKQALNNLRNYQAGADSVLDSVQGHDKDETFAQKATRTTAEVNKDNAYEAVLTAQNNLKYGILVSPISGTVTDTNNLVAGLNLTGSDLETKFIRIADLSTLYFEALIDEVDFSKVHIGQEVTVNVDAFPGKDCKGSVSYLGKDGEETIGGVVTIPTEIALSNCDLAFAIGLNGQAHFVVSKLENVLVIPKKYLVNKDGKDYVWKKTGDTLKNRKLVPVKVGISNSSDAEIREGISEGDLIIFIP